MRRRGFLKALAALPFVGSLFGKEKLPDKPEQAFIGGFDLAGNDGDRGGLQSWTMTVGEGKPIEVYWEAFPTSMVTVTRS